MKAWRVLAASVLMVSLLMVGGCSSAEKAAEPEAPAAEPAGLTGVTWNCYEFSVSGKPMTVLSSAPITAEFAEDGTMGGSSGVNTYSTMYSVEGEAISLTGEIATTKKAGPDDAMAQETNYLTTLPTAASFKIQPNGDLVLFGPAKNMIARYHPAQ